MLAHVKVLGAVKTIKNRSPFISRQIPYIKLLNKTIHLKSCVKSNDITK